MSKTQPQKIEDWEKQSLIKRWFRMIGKTKREDISIMDLEMLVKMARQEEKEKLLERIKLKEKDWPGASQDLEKLKEEIRNEKI